MSDRLPLGKLPNSVLKKHILGKLPRQRSEAVVGPGIGEDCSVLEMPEGYTVLTSDPITGATEGLGRLAVTVSVNDLASAGAEPIGVMVTLMAPEGSVLEDILRVTDEISAQAEKYGMDVLGGHTEVTQAVNKMIVSVTAVGTADKSLPMFKEKPGPGHWLYMTKWAGLEGTAILASDFREKLRTFVSEQLLDEACGMFDNTSVLKEGRLAAPFVSGMHDITEGGVLGAVWEMAEAAGAGAEIHETEIPVKPSTMQICSVAGVSPYRLISSGCMLMSTRTPELLEQALISEGICFSRIGQLTNTDKCIFIRNDGHREILGEPESDELYPAVARLSEI